MMVLGAAAAAAPSQAATCAARADVRAMTYNIRLDVAVDGANRWANRRTEFLAQIKLVRPDLLGLQEVVPGQYADLRQGLPGYAFVGGGRDDGAGQGEASPLAVNRQAFSIGASGMFWLSPTPAVPSLGWDAAYRRVATWAHLRRRSDGVRLLVLNTHWDHVGLEARRNSALQLRSWIGAHRRAGEAVVLLGDFNAPLSEASMQALLDDRELRDSRAAAREPAVGTTITFNAFDPFPKSGQTIDHILVGGADVARYHALAEHFEGRVASDHFPVVADISPSCGTQR
jgi:endonuclease/exonuclease/phosphatase family metal-dependent hydrolase